MQKFFLQNSLVALGSIMLCIALRAQEDENFSLLRWFYQQPLGRLSRTFFSHRCFSRLTGWFMNRKISQFYIKPFIRKHAINMDEVLLPIEAFKTFNQFFTRELKPNARSIDHSPDALISPADGAITVVNNVQADTDFLIKGMRLNMPLFLADNELATYYYGGTMIVIRLAPHDYHRFHMPCKGKVLPHCIIKGRFESVNPISYFSGVQPLEINERHLIEVETSQCGIVAMIAVGAMCVGRIKETYTPYGIYDKGDQLGYFEFGGSTIVLLFKKDALLLDARFAKATLQSEVPIKMGERLGIISTESASQIF